MSKNAISIGIIIGNRDFFPDSLVEKARIEIIEVFVKYLFVIIYTNMELNIP